MRQPTNFQRFDARQTGQSVVIIAVVMVALLAFVGLAIDLGLVWVRRAQLTAAVDAAALAGVVELESQAGLNGAIIKANQFLYSNDIPEFVVSSSPTLTRYMPGSNAIGASEFTVTATWPVELYFMRLLGFDEFRVQHSATAAYFPLVDIYASRRVELGTLTASNQAVFGPNCVTSSGDPFSPSGSTFRPNNHYVNPNYPSTYFSYRYRILIPSDYETRANTNVVRVELFDPDTYNHTRQGNTDYSTYVITHTLAAQAAGLPATETFTCNFGTNDYWYRYQPCVRKTNENIELNPFWFVKVDEIRSGNGSSCGTPANKDYNNGHRTQTAFDLYYYHVNEVSGLIEPVNIATYIGREDNQHDTDLRWVSPGGDLSYDQTIDVPTLIPGTSFEVNLDTISDILRDQTTQNRYLYLDVTTLTGASENGYELWAGPPHYAGPKDTSTSSGCGTGQPVGTPSKANERNVFVANCGRNSHSSYGVGVFAMGNLPMNSNTNDPVELPLIYVGPEYAGSQILISLFDSDSGARGPVVFHFDTLAYNLQSPVPNPPANPVNTNTTDWSMAFSVGGTYTNDPDLGPGETRCVIGNNCGSVWVTPAYRILVPTLDPARCVDPVSTPQWCTPFYGGRLIARYIGGETDTYGWQIRLPGLPYIIR